MELVERNIGALVCIKPSFKTAERKHGPFCLLSKTTTMRSTALKTVSCGHQGERDVVRHIDGVQHKKNCKAMNMVKANHTKFYFH